MKTLDLILCAGTGRFSRIIQRTSKIMGYRGESAEISHVARVVKLTWAEVCRLCDMFKITISPDPNGLYVFESTTLNWNGKKGVQINPYDQWLKNYQGKVWTRQIACEPPDGVADWMASQVGRPYENGLGGLIELATIYIPLSLFKGRTVEAHCSEIIAECLQYFGLMTNKVNPSKLPPPLWYGDGLDNLMNCRINKPERIK